MVSEFGISFVETVRLDIMFLREVSTLDVHVNSLIMNSYLVLALLTIDLDSGYLPVFSTA